MIKPEEHIEKANQCINLADTAVGPAFWEAIAQAHVHLHAATVQPPVDVVINAGFRPTTLDNATGEDPAELSAEVLLAQANRRIAQLQADLNEQLNYDTEVRRIVRAQFHDTTVTAVSRAMHELDERAASVAKLQDELGTKGDPRGPIQDLKRDRAALEEIKHEVLKAFDDINVPDWRAHLTAVRDIAFRPR